MKRTRFAITLFACLLGLVGMAQNTVVEGTKLNIGENNTVTGVRSGAIGQYNIVGAVNALAVGYGDTIDVQNANNSFTLGTLNRIGGSSSFGFGQDVKVLWDYGLGLGRYLKATGQDDCMVIGSGFPSSGLKPKRFLENEYGYSLMIGFKSIHPTLTVGPSPNNYPSGDTLGKTGKVAIGDVPVTDIAAKLHIRSDYGENAGLILESKDPATSNAFIRMRDAGHGIEVDNDGEMTIRSMDNQDLRSLVLQGRVGINITNENDRYALAVNGGILTPNHNEKRNTVANTFIGDALAEPHHKEGTANEDDNAACPEERRRSTAVKRINGGGRGTQLVHHVGDVGGSLHGRYNNGEPTSDLIHFSTATFTITLHFLEVGHHHHQQLDDNRSCDVGHNAECKNRGIGECTTREHVEESHQALGTLFLQSLQLRGVNTWQHDVRTDAVDKH